MKTIRLTDILILLVGFAVLIDTSVQLGRPDDDVVWQPVTDEDVCCDSNAVGDLDPVFIA